MCEWFFPANDNLFKLGYDVLVNDFVDNIRIARKVLTELRHHRLGDLADYYLIDTTGAHRGLKDSYITHQIFLKLKDETVNQYSSFNKFLECIKRW